MRVKKAVESIFRKYQTRDPFEIASCENIQMFTEPLGSVQGYYNKVFQQRMIHLNQELDDEERRRTCAHEFGHCILHLGPNTPFLRANTLFPIGKYEREAKHFAVDILYSDEDMQEYLQHSTPQIADCLKLPIQLVEYRISVMERPPELTE
jgi:Zn-dependent peptidase ImmA (M78 family)